MASLPRGVLALAMVTAMGSTGCWQLLGVTAEILTAVATAPRSSPSRNGSDLHYSREDATPVEGPVDREMSRCELERGRWREAHQDQDDPPPTLRCLPDGAYPPLDPPPARSTVPATSPTGPQAPATAASSGEQAPAGTDLLLPATPAGTEPQAPATAEPPGEML